MILLLGRLLRHVIGRSWAVPAFVIGAVFATSWPAMVLAEGPSAPVVAPENYWWWFIVTASTVGYGDYYPTTPFGHVVGAYVIAGGIATLASLLTRIAVSIESAHTARMRGATTVDSSGHDVILGYWPGRTERMIDELLADSDRGVVLAAWPELATHPIPQRPVSFVRGELTDIEVLARAGVPEAAGVLIDARDDNEALAVAVSVSHISPAGHVVVALRDLGRTAQLHFVNPRLQSAQWHNPRILTEELQSPGISRVYAELMTHGGRNTYSALVSEPTSVRFGEYQRILGERFAATVLAVDTDDALLISPSMSTPVPAGSRLYYICERRLDDDEIRAVLSGSP